MGFKDFIFEYLQLRKLNKLDPSEKNLIFYSESENQWDFYEEIILQLIKKKINICYVTSSKKEYLRRKNYKNFKKFYIGSGITRTIFFSTINTKVLVMSLPDLNTFHIKRSKYPVHYIFVPHNLLSTHMIFRRNAFDNYDSFFSSGEHQNNEIRESEILYKTKKKELLNFGCSRLDKIIYMHKNHKKESKDISVLISPSWGKNGLLESGAENLVENLLKEKITVILRPHPDTLRLKPNCVKNLLYKYNKNKYLIYKPDVSSLDDYFKVDLMISDWSGSAYEFAFGTLKPVIFVDVSKKVNNPEYIKFKNKPIEIELRNKIGVLIKLKNTERVSKVINKMVSEKKQWREKIFKIRKKLFFNVEKSGITGANFILKKL